MKTHQVQQKTERRISAALRLVFVAALLLGQIALAFFLSTELRQRAAIIYTVLELAAFGYAVRIYNRTDGASYKFGWIFLVLTVPVVGLILYRLDSGDMAYLTRKARKMLDEAGWTECQISVSNSLDEYLIQDLLLQDAKIDLFGVGERMITAKSEPVFGGVYKLAAVEDQQGNITPKIKISENVEKITIPHFKKVYRFYGNDTGKAIADYLTLHDETVDDTTDLTIFDPMATWKRKDVYNFEARELLVPVFLGGKRVYDSPSLDEIKAYWAQQVDTLWDVVKRFDYPHKYYVDLSQKLWDIQQGLLRSSR